MPGPRRPFLPADVVLIDVGATPQAGASGRSATLSTSGAVRGLMADEDWWPLPGPVRRDRPFLLLTELDPTDMSVIRVCLVPTRAAHITTGAPPGSAWMLADQVYLLPPGIGGDAGPLDVAALLDRARHPAEGTGSDA